MAIMLPTNVVNFANNDKDRLDVYEGMRDLYFHSMSERTGRTYGDYDKTVSLREKDEKLSQHLFSEIETMSGVKRDGQEVMLWANNPMVKWAVDAVRTMTIEAILPYAIDASIGVYADIQNVDFGQTAQFDIKPNSLMSVSRVGNAQRTAWVQKQFETTVTLSAEKHAVTVQASFYKVLAGKESLAEFMRKAVISIEREMTADAYIAMTALLAKSDFPTALKKSGYTADNLLDLCQTVSAYNDNNKAVIVGTAKAISKIFPNATAGARVVTDSNNMTIKLIKEFYDYDTLVLPQIAKGDANYSLTLRDDQIYVISPSSDKIVKGVVEGVALSNSNDYYDNANLTSNYTIDKRWTFSAVTNSKIGVINL